MMFKFIPAALATLSFLSSVSAWAALGHSTVANVAMQFLLPQTLTSVSSILFADPYKHTTNPNLVDVANWAIIHTISPEGWFSSGFFRLAVKDNPPTSCGVDFARDCNDAGGCIITAIKNYTERVQDNNLDAEQRAEALKFLVSLFGEVTEPLRVEARWDTTALWNGAPVMLYDVWELWMPARLAGDGTLANVVTWTKTIRDIIDGTYQSFVPSWLSCTDIKNAQTCATEWASDTNALICSYVLNPIPTRQQELNDTYFSGAGPIIEMQIAKGGVRLAAWLNKIFTGSTGFEAYTGQAAA